MLRESVDHMSGAVLRIQTSCSFASAAGLATGPPVSSMKDSVSLEHSYFPGRGLASSLTVD